MANDLEQIELFARNPEILNFGITDVKLRDGQIIGGFSAGTEANDIAQLTPDQWAKAHAEQVVKLTGANAEWAHKLIDLAWTTALAKREREERQRLLDAQEIAPVTPITKGKRG